MSDEESNPATGSPVPWGLVEHVNRTKTGKTTLQISLPIETRARLAQASLDLGCSKLALIRTAINQFLIAHEITRQTGQERAYQAVETIPVPTQGPGGIVPDPEPQMTVEPAVAEPKPEIPPGPEQSQAVPEQAPTPKQSRGRKGKAQ